MDRRRIVSANPIEVNRAIQAEALARATRKAIQSLPQRVGSSVVWANGLVWTRTGDDQWMADDHPIGQGAYPSAHVATATFIVEVRL